MARKKLMTLDEYLGEVIKNVGLETVKKQFGGVSESTINYWRRADALPRPNQIMRLVKLSEGRVTVASMTSDYLKRVAQKTRKTKKAAV